MKIALALLTLAVMAGTSSSAPPSASAQAAKATQAPALTLLANLERAGPW